MTRRNVNNTGVADAKWAFFDQAPFPYALLNSAGVLVHANPCFERLLGVERGGLSGRTLASLSGNSGNSVFLRKLRGFLGGVRKTPLELQLVRVDGRKIQFRAHRQDGGVPSGDESVIVAAFEDLSHRERGAGVDVPELARLRELEVKVREQAELEETLRRSQERLSMAFWGGDLFWWDWHRAGNTLEYSSRFADITGVTPSHTPFLLEELPPLIHPDDHSAGYAAYCAHESGAVPFMEVLFRLRDAAGGWRWMHLRGRIVERGADGVPTRMLGIAQDVSQSKQVSDERDLLFSHSRDLLAVMSHDGSFRQVNPAWTEVLGWSWDELLATPSIRLTHPEDIPAGMAAVSAVVEERRHAQFEQRILGKSGDYRWFSCNCVPVPDRDVFIVIARDIGDMKEREEGQRRLADELGLRVAERTRELDGKVRDLMEREHELRLHESRLAETLNLASLAEWEFEPDTNQFVFSDRFYGQFETTAEREGGYRMSPEEVWRRFLPQDRPNRVREVIGAILQNPEPDRLISFEQEVLLGGGGRALIATQVRVETTTGGGLRRFFGVNRITARLG